MAKKKEDYKPSLKITEFLNEVEKCRVLYENAYDGAGEEDKKLQTLLHDLELAPDRNTQARAATKLRQSRKERRRYKDEVDLYKPMYNFYELLHSKKFEEFLKALRRLQNEQIAAEKYIYSERQFKNRVE